MITLRNKEEFGYIVKNLGLNKTTSLHIVEDVMNGIECNVQCQELDTSSVVSALFTEENGVMVVYMSYDVCAADKGELQIINDFSNRAQMLCDVANKFYGNMRRDS